MFSNDEKTLRLTFWQATNGEQLVSLVVVLPWKFDTETVYIETNTSLAGLTVIDALTMPLFQYLDLHTRECARDGTVSTRQLLLRRPCFERKPVDELDIFLVASRPKLRNLRGPSRYRVFIAARVEKAKKGVSRVCARFATTTNRRHGYCGVHHQRSQAEAGDSTCAGSGTHHVASCRC